MRALVLSGGGSLGAFQVGALEVLLKPDAEYDIICGVSVGALNAAYLAQAPQGKLAQQNAKLKELWLNLRTPQVRKKWAAWGEMASLWKPSVYDSSPLRKLVYDELNVTAVRDSGRQVYVGAVDWATGEYRAASAHEPKFHEWVLASSSYPVFLEPVQIEGRMWSDGGLRDVTPLGDAIRMGAQIIDVIMCSSEKQKIWAPKAPNALQYALRAVDLLADEVIRNDLRVAQLKNALSATGDKRYKQVGLRVIRPGDALTGNALDFVPETTRERLNLGAAAAR